MHCAVLAMYTVAMAIGYRSARMNVEHAIVSVYEASTKMYKYCCTIVDTKLHSRDKYATG